MSGAELSSVAYKKGSWMRYVLWGLAAICIALLAATFVNMMNGEISAAVPEGYKFSITDNYTEGSKIRTTYYVYTDKILVEDESFEDSAVNRSMLIYDGVDTSTLSYDSEAVAASCEPDTPCKAQTKVITTIKKLISHRIGREYIGL